MRVRKRKSVGTKYAHCPSHQWARNPREKGTDRRQRPTPLRIEKYPEWILSWRRWEEWNYVGHPASCSEQLFGDMAADGGPAATLCSRSQHRRTISVCLQTTLQCHKKQKVLVQPQWLLWPWKYLYVSVCICATFFQNIWCANGQYLRTLNRTFSFCVFLWLLSTSSPFTLGLLWWFKTEP